MPIDAGIFGNESRFEDRYLPDYPTLARRVDSFRGSGLRIVLTMGSFDLFHEGHALYLEAAKSLGDVLIVGVDSDEKIRQRKGPHRPGVPEVERLRLLAHIRHVDIITMKAPTEPKWSLIKCIRPDVLQATEATYSPNEIEQLREYCKEVVVQKPMATTTTSARIRKFFLTGAEEISKELSAEFPEMLQRVFDRLKNGKQKT
jgi:D-glycero-beta-D-manno-heptose 1-phosphate adenylyltransferase